MAIPITLAIGFTTVFTTVPVLIAKNVILCDFYE